MKKCPPGIICIENVTMFFLFVTVLIVGYLMYANIFRQHKVVERPINMIVEQQSSWPYFAGVNGWFDTGGTAQIGNQIRPDVLLNPYTPPFRDERYMTPNIVSGRIPINVSTNVGAVDTNYRQVGILTPLNGSSKGKILPLMGRPLFTNRNKWQYYTMSDQNNSIKLPISRGGRSCTNEYGTDELFNSDSVYVEGYNDAYKITVYDNDTIRYLPYL